MRKLLISLSIAAMAAVPFASMADDAEVTVPLGDADSSLPTLYVDADGPGIWQESNDAIGLQTTDTFDEEGNLVLPKDTQVA